MVAAVEVGQNGEAAFASLREPAWHGLGTVFESEVSTSEMLRLAHLNDWNVRLEAVPLPHEAYKEWFMVVRDNPFTSAPDVLGIVGKRYKEVQNEDLFSFGDNILDGGGRWETAGSIKNGTVVFGSLALERETVLDPSGVSDVVNTYLLVHTSHDGSLAVQASVTPVRVVCQNTLNMALRGVKQSYKIRHTQTVDGRVQAAREALGLANQFMDEFDKMAADLFEREINDIKFDEIVKAIYPVPDVDVKGSMTKWQNKTDLIWDIYRSETQDGIRNTAWGALNALTERLDWYRTARGENSESIAAAASGFDVAVNAEKGRILSAVQTLTV